MIDPILNKFTCTSGSLEITYYYFTDIIFIVVGSDQLFIVTNRLRSYICTFLYVGWRLSCFSRTRERRKGRVRERDEGRTCNKHISSTGRMKFGEDFVGVTDEINFRPPVR